MCPFTNLSSFTVEHAGTAVTLTFYPHVNGSIASVAIDGKDVAIVDTLSTEECQHSAKSMFWTADALAATSHNISVTIRSPRSQKWVAIGPFMCVPTTVLGTSHLDSRLGRYAALDDPSSTLSPFQYKAPDTGTIVGAVLGGVTTVAFVVLGVVFIILRRRMRLNMPVLSTLGDDTLVTTQTQTMTLGTLQFSKRGRQDTSTVREDSTSKRLPPRAPRVDKAVGPDVDEGGGVNLYNKKPSRLKRGVTESGGLNLSRKPSKVGIAQVRDCIFWVWSVLLTSPQTEEPPQLPPLPGAGSPLPSPTTAAFAVASKGTEGHENAPGASRNEPHGEAEGITEVKRT